jgi:hypothetical protein
LAFPTSVASFLRPKLGILHQVFWCREFDGIRITKSLDPGKYGEMPAAHHHHHHQIIKSSNHQIIIIIMVDYICELHVNTSSRQCW